MIQLHYLIFHEFSCILEFRDTLCVATYVIETAIYEHIAISITANKLNLFLRIKKLSKLKRLKFISIKADINHTKYILIVHVGTNDLYVSLRWFTTHAA